jgi:hypothetical protein
MKLCLCRRRNRRHHTAEAQLALGILLATLALCRPIPAAAAPLPCRQPQLAADGQAVYLTCGANNTIYLSRSTDGGRSFAPLTTVASVPSLALGMHRGPRVAIADEAVIVTAIGGTVGKGQDGDLLAWRSVDRGRTWTGPAVINDVPAAAREGLHAMAARGKTIVTAWLDLREKGTRLYSATSIDGGRTWAPDALVYESPSGTICQCCHPSLTIAADGTVLAMFRNVVDGHRDLYLARARNGRFGAAEKIGTGTWLFDSCPLDGGGIATTSDGGIETVWRRDKTVFLAPSGQEEVKVAKGVNPAIVSTGAGPVIAWNAPDGLSIAAPERATTLLDPAGKFVALAVSDAGVIAAWERGEQTLTRVLPSPGRATRRSSEPRAARR